MAHEQRHNINGSDHIGLPLGALIVGSGANFNLASLTTLGQGQMLITSAGLPSGLTWVNTTGAASSNSGGLAGTGGFYVTYTNDTTLSNQKVLAAGSSVNLKTDSTSIYITALTGNALYATPFYFMSVLTNRFLTTNSPRVYIAGQVNATGMGNTIFPINSMHCVPMYISRSMAIDSFGCVLTLAGSATTQIQFGIYSNISDTDLWPSKAIATSGLLTGSNAVTLAINPAQTISNNSLLWAVYYVINSAVTLKSVAAAGGFPVFGMEPTLSSGNVPLGISIALVSSTLPSVMIGSGNNLVSNFPAMFYRLSA